MLTAGILGWPVAHSKSPIIHRFWLAKLGIDGDYSRFAVHPDNLGAAIRALPKLGIAGVNVTVPHKVAVTKHLDRIVPHMTPEMPPTREMVESEHWPMFEAALKSRPLTIGAVNTVVVESGELVGYNTDVAGFIGPLNAAMSDWPDGRIATLVTLIGTGGAARAVAAALYSWDVTVYGRDEKKAADLADSFGLGGGSGAGFSQPLSALDKIDWYREVEGSSSEDKIDQRYSQVIINATSLGMAGQPALAIDLRPFPDDTIVYDLVYAPLETPLLAAAKARGMRTIDGLEMLVGQAAAAFELFFGQPAPREHDAELRALLTVQ